MSKFNVEKEMLDDISLNDTAFLNSQDANEEPEIPTEISLKISKNNLNNSKHHDSNSFKNTFKCNLNSTRTEKGPQGPLVINTSLSSWGLPESILMKYKERGICDMFTWQAECLGNRKVLENNCNLVYSAPTSAGKTLVAEILALKTVLEKQKKVIVILPFVSVVREKMFYFQDILGMSGIRVEGFMGSHCPRGGFKAVQFAVCTIEKANSIINSLLEDGTVGDLGSVIIDEMHLLGDSSRGYLLELLLTKLRYMSSRNTDINIQLIGMSATLPNLDLLAKWLNAELYITNFRPIPLYEYCLISGEIFDNSLQMHRRLQPSSDLTEDSDNILQLCLETISSSCSVLIFCPTKNWCENLAQQLSLAFWKLGRSKSSFGQCLRQQLNTDNIIEILEQLKRCPVGLDSILKKTVSFGVAFHHAGLTMDERDIIEGAFRSGALRVLIATSTLSSGVNLPAQRVIIRTPLFHGKPIDSLTYRQMIGRAGRMGKDTSGESILIAQNNDKRIAKELMAANLRPIESCLEGAGKLKRAILEVIASGVATTPDDIRLFTNCTLLAASLDGDLRISNPIDESVNFLVNNEFIRLQKNEEGELQYVATSLAKACLSSSLPPEEGLALFEEIEKARQCFVLDTDLHLLYLVTPYSVCNQWSNLDWMLFLDIWEKLPPCMKRVAELVGVRESFIFNATRGKINTSTSKLYQRLQVHRRFYTALALQDLVNEIPLNDVAHKFQCSRGMLQSLQQSASMFAGMVTSFCYQLKWKCVEILVSQFQDRLQFGIQHDLLDLMKLPSLNGPRARTLHKAGIETLADLASCDPCKLENLLHSSVPFQSEKEREGENAYDVEQKKKMRGIWITGKQGLTAREAADMLIKEARRYLQFEVGAAVMKWETDTTKTDSNTSMSSQTSSLSNTSINSEHIASNHINKIENTDVKNDTVISKEKIKEKEMNTSHNKNENHENIEEKEINTSRSKNENIEEKEIDASNIEIEDHESIINVSDIIEEEIVNVSTSNVIQNISNSLNTYDNNTSFVTKKENLETNGNNSLINNKSINECDTHNTLSNIDEQPIKEVTHNIVMSDDDDVFDYDWTPLDNEIISLSINTSNIPSKPNESSVLKNTSTFEFSFNKSTFNASAKSDSLFEDSLLLDSKLCDALDYSATNNESNSEVEIGGDTSLFENAFNTFLDTEQQIEENIPEGTNKISEINKSDDVNDVVEASQVDFENTSSLMHSLHYSVKKNKNSANHTPRKRNRDPEIELLSEKRVQCLLEETPKKRQKYCEQGNENNRKINDYANHSLQTKNDNFETVDLTSADIIDVCENKELFSTFCKELKTKSEISFAVACEHFAQEKPLIGQTIFKTSNSNISRNNSEQNKLIDGERLVTGIAISWGGNTVYYISFVQLKCVQNEDKLKLLQTILNNNQLSMRIFDCKEQCKVLYNSCKISINCSMEDPKVADWLLEPEGHEKNLQAMALRYSPEAVGIAQLAGSCKGVGSIALNPHNAILSRIRASIEAIVTWHVVESQKEVLTEQNVTLLNTYQTEMKSISCLTQMELTGLCIDKFEMNKLITTIQEQMGVLQQQAFALAGRRFSFTSSKDVAKVIGIYRGRKVSTNKQTLEQNENPISNLILQWRKLSCTLTKMLFPIMRSITDDRIHGCSVTHTSTGRITMQEPNLQNVPRNFEVQKSDGSVVSLSVRGTFIPATDKVFLSADYCQLELRLLAHLSQDSVLCNIMRIGSDVFKLIAAKLNKIPESKVTDVLRQRAKQLCYGIIYGMGIKALSEQLGSSEEEAAEFMVSFKNTYPGIQIYIQRTIELCRENVYVETLAGRRRYLPHITDENPAIKSQAERQAINTTVQGSAADIAKKAMVSVDLKLKHFFPSQEDPNKSRVALALHLHDELMYEVPVKDLKSVTKIVKCAMEQAVKLSIPFPVKLKSGPSWGQLEEINI